jgi:lysophospholipase L1-like esterase
MPARWKRFVAVGDSFTEGLDDLLEDGYPRGWADQVAAHFAAQDPDFRYANLAVRSQRVEQIVMGQIPEAMAMRPDLTSIVAGGNDILGFRLDQGLIADIFDLAVSKLAESGATVVVFTGFDPAGRLPFSERLGRRVKTFNQRIRASVAANGAILIDLWSMTELADPRLWGPDRLHLAASGHQHVAGVVLEALGETPTFEWPVTVETPWQPSRLARRLDDLSWSQRHLAPWIIRKVRGRALGDGRYAKRPDLSPYPTNLADCRASGYDDTGHGDTTDTADLPA